MVDEETKLLM